MKKRTVSIVIFTFLSVPFTTQSMEWKGNQQNPVTQHATFTSPSAQKLAEQFDQPDEKAFLLAVGNSTEKTINKQYLDNTQFIDNASIGLLTAAHVIADQQGKQKIKSKLRSIINRQFPYANR